MKLPSNLPEGNQFYNLKYRTYWQSSLFNEDYLQFFLPKQKIWTEENKEFFKFQNDFIHLCNAFKNENLDHWNEADTIRNWIIPIMEMLGWHDKSTKHTNPILDNLSLSVIENQKVKNYRPDLIYVDDPDEKKLVNIKDQEQKKTAAQTYSKMILEAKAWRVLEINNRKEQVENDRKRKIDHSKDDTAGLSFEDQCLKYINILGLKFGILTDGYIWKLLHESLSNEGSNKRSFQFNLGHSFRTAISLNRDRTQPVWQEFTENLRYFFYIFRKKSFCNSGSEQVLSDVLIDFSKKYADSIEDDLRDSFVSAMTIICNGYKESIRNPLKSEQLEMIRNVSESHLFNILFIKSCETRNILPIRNPHYYKTSIADIENSYFDISLSKFLDTIEYPSFNPDADKDFNSKRMSTSVNENYGCKYNPNGTEIYDRLLHLYKIVQNGDFGLKIKGFKETVFSQEEWFFAEKYKIKNDSMIRLLFCLGYTKSKTPSRPYQQIPYSYFNPRQLGSIYESFLEFTLLDAKTDLVYEKKQWKPANLKSLDILEKYKHLEKVYKGQLYFSYDTTKRKSQGSYYTPDYIVRYLVEETLNPLLEGLSPQEIMSLCICDPAIGSGHFLNAALEFLTKRYRSSLADLMKDDLIEDEIETRQKILHSCIYGADINSRAVKLGKMGLWLATAHPHHSLEPLDHQLKVVDSLSDAIQWKHDFKNPKKNGGFDAVIMNPPYIGEKGNKDKFTDAKAGPLAKHYQGKMDYFYFFVHLALDILKPDGRCGLISTNYFTTALGARKLRKDLKERSAITSIINLGNWKVFDDAQGQHNMIWTLTKANYDLSCRIFNLQGNGVLDQTELDKVLSYQDKKLIKSAQQSAVSSQQSAVST